MFQLILCLLSFLGSIFKSYSHGKPLVAWVLASYLKQLALLLSKGGGGVGAGSPTAMQLCHPRPAKLLPPFAELPFATDSILLVYNQLEKNMVTTRNQWGFTKKSHAKFTWFSL